jgi:hypothetical protein
MDLLLRIIRKIGKLVDQKDKEQSQQLPAWLCELKVPAGACDQCHLFHLTGAQLRELAEGVGLVQIEMQQLGGTQDYFVRFQCSKSAEVAANDRGRVSYFGVED